MGYLILMMFIGLYIGVIIKENQNKMPLYEA